MTARLLTVCVILALSAGLASTMRSASPKMMLSGLEKRGLIHEVTGRASFRFYTPTPFMNLR
jgi:hypothetical protein